MASVLIETYLYNGKFHLVHNPHARGSQPRYVVTKDGDKSKPVGVTTILSQTLSKDLMQWAVDCAINHLSDKLDDGITAKHLEEAGQAYITKRDFGASTGSEAHALVEQYLKGEPMTLATATAEARKAYSAFVRWFEGSHVEVIDVERCIYHDQLDYAGTYDGLFRIDGKVCLGDLKTTNASRYAPKGVYYDYFLQLGAYAEAHERQRVWEEANGGSVLLPIDDLVVISARKDGHSDIVRASDLGLTVDECRQRWAQVVDVYRFKKQLTKQLGGR